MEAVGIEGPASHVGKTLPFGKTKLAQPDLLFGSLSLVNTNARSIPLDDVAVRIAKCHFAVEHPEVFSIGSADARFVFVGFSRSRRRLAT